MSAYEAIADPTRRRILDLLREQPLPAGQLASHFPVSRPAVSRHLRGLRRAGPGPETRRGHQRRPIPALGHLNAFYWPTGLRDNPESCVVANDPRGFGLAYVAQ